MYPQSHKTEKMEQEYNESRVLTSRLGCGGGLHTPQSFPESIYSRFTGVDEKKRKRKGPWTSEFFIMISQ